jgi:hypothetical protein
MEWSCHEVFENWGILEDIGGHRTQVIIQVIGNVEDIFMGKLVALGHYISRNPHMDVGQHR